MTDPRRLDELSRRDFLGLAARGLLGVTALPLLGATPLWAGDPPATGRKPTARNVIYLYMAGGMSHLDTFDPKPGAETQGPVKAIASSADGIQVSEYLPLLGRQMHHAAILRSVTSTQGAHEQGDYFVHTSYTMRGTVRHPALGAWLAFLSGRTNGTLPGNVVVGGGSRHPGAGFLESKFAPLPIGNPTAGLQHSTLPKGVEQERFDRRLELKRRFVIDRGHGASFAQCGFQSVWEPNSLTAFKSAFTISSARIRSSAPDNRLAHSCCPRASAIRS